MCRGAQECKARARASFDTVINRIQISDTPESDDIFQTDGAECDASTMRAKTRLREALVEYIEQFKEKAFQTTFIEPIKVTNDRHHIIQTNVFFLFKHYFDMQFIYALIIYLTAV